MFEFIIRWLIWTQNIKAGHWDLSLVTTCVEIAVATLIAAYVLYIVYRPLNRVRDLHEVGFWHLRDIDKRKNVSLRDLVNEVVKQQKQGNDLPPVYPNGWFVIAESRDLKHKSVIPVSALGQNVVVFRGEDGSAHVLDAHCPHLGANLAVGGRVLGNCIECPFHGWRFKGSDGSCDGIPYADKIPSIAKIRAWDSREVNGYIYMWYHAEGAKPYWEPVEVKEISLGKLVYRGRSENYVRAHIQELPENGADVAHLGKLHGPNLLLGTDLRNFYRRMWDMSVHVWEASWKVSSEETPHISEIHVHHVLRFFGKINLFTAKAIVNQIGPSNTHLNFDTPFGKAVLFHNSTPMEPLLQKVTHSLYCESSLPVLYCKLILILSSITMERDMTIWNSKIFLNKPILAKEDKFISKMRKWYTQFYSENSPKLTFRNDSLDW